MTKYGVDLNTDDDEDDADNMYAIATIFSQKTQKNQT